MTASGMLQVPLVDPARLAPPGSWTTRLERADMAEFTDAAAGRLFWPKVDVGHPLGCWLWVGSNDDRYGRIMYGRRNLYAHRVAYQLLQGSIPQGLTLDHLCRRPLCVNPDHLEPVPMAENIRRGTSPAARNARKTHCINGHAFTEDNVYPVAGGGRSCRECHRVDARERYRADPETGAARAREYRRRNAELVNARARERRRQKRNEGQ